MAETTPLVVLGAGPGGHAAACLAADLGMSVVMIDEEGIPYRYSGLEGFLLDLQMRAPSKFELDDWMG